MRGVEGGALRLFRNPSACQLNSRSRVATTVVVASASFPQSQPVSKHLQVVWVTTEVAPWSKTGGLGDVAAALPTQLAARGHRIMTVSPMYEMHADMCSTGVTVPVLLPEARRDDDSASASPRTDGFGGEPSTSGRGQPCGFPGSHTTERHRALLRRLQRQQARERPQRASEAARDSGGQNHQRHSGQNHQRHCSSDNDGGSGGGDSSEPPPLTMSLSREGRGKGSGNSVTFARLFAAHVDGVDHVFVDHPLFRTDPTEMTYTDEGSGSSAVGMDRGLLAQARSSLLCQAALAAPALLWLSGGGVRWRSGADDGRAATTARMIRHGRVVAAGDYVSAGSSLDAMLARFRTVERKGAPLFPTRRLFSSSEHEVGDTSSVEDILRTPLEGDDELRDSSNVIFVGNDWTSGLLPLWLDAYSEAPERDDQAEEEGVEVALMFTSGSSLEDVAIGSDEAQHEGLKGKEALRSALSGFDVSVSRGQHEAHSPRALSAVNGGRGSGPGRPEWAIGEQRVSGTSAEASSAPPGRADMEHSDKVSSDGSTEPRLTGSSVAAVPFLSMTSCRGVEGSMPHTGHDMQGGSPRPRLASQGGVKEGADRVQATAASLRARGSTPGSSARVLRAGLREFQKLVLSKLRDARFALAIHNFGFHGLFDAASFPRLGLPQRHLQLLLTHTDGASPTGGADSHSSNPPKAKISWLQAALLSSDLAVTVSPQHAREICDSAAEALSATDGSVDRSDSSALVPVRMSHAQVAAGGPLPSPAMAAALLPHSTEGSKGLQGTVMEAQAGLGDGAGRRNERGLLGIMNGIDLSLWDPSRDPYLPLAARYGAETVDEGKARAKVILQRRLGLRPDPHTPLFVFIGRLEDQKGVDVLLAALPDLLGEPLPRDGRSIHNAQLHADPKASQSASTASCRHPSTSRVPLSLSNGPPEHQTSSAPLQLAVLGRGQAWLEQAVSCLEVAYPGVACGIPHHNEALAHLMVAAADFVVVPSRYEPCGLIAMCAVRYGAVPIVAPVGGLIDIADGTFGQDGGTAAGQRDVDGTWRRSDASSIAMTKAEAANAEKDCTLSTAAAGLQPPMRGSAGYASPAAASPPISPLGYILRSPIGPSNDSLQTREAVAVLVSGMLSAAKDYYTRPFPSERIPQEEEEESSRTTGQITSPASVELGPSAGGGGFLDRRSRCMRSDMSWARAVGQWELALGSLASLHPRRTDHD